MDNIVYIISKKNIIETFRETLSSIIETTASMTTVVDDLARNSDSVVSVSEMTKETVKELGDVKEDERLGNNLRVT